MEVSRPVLVIAHGGAGHLPAEQAVNDARVAAARATCATALAAGFEAVIVMTDEARRFAGLPDRVIVEPDEAAAPFAFDTHLRALVRRYALERPVVMGSGALPLASRALLRSIRDQLAADGRFLITNNFFSADLTGWTPGNAIQSVTAFSRDNVLPRRLRDEAGLESRVLGRSTETQFDLDTPADLAVLALHDGVPESLRAALRPGDLPLTPYRGIMRAICDRDAELVVAGRVGSATWQYLERETACRVRMVSEERGLATAPPDHRPRSTMGFLVEAFGVAGFFDRLMDLGDAFVLDTRVFEAHLGVTPSREERFQSDLLRPEAITDDFLRAFTTAARDAPKPVILGGHSLVAGGLMALTDVAWRENDRRIAPA